MMLYMLYVVNMCVVCVAVCMRCDAMRAAMSMSMSVSMSVIGQIQFPHTDI